MNERVRQLVRQAGLDDADFPIENWDNVPLAKFAQLIVRECIEKITTYDLVPGHSAKWEDIYDIHTRLLQDLGEELKEHFGVTK